MGAAAVVVDRTAGLTELSTLRVASGNDQKRAFLREMPQESWEIYTLRPAWTINWTAPLPVLNGQTFICPSEMC